MHKILWLVIIVILLIIIAITSIALLSSRYHDARTYGGDECRKTGGCMADIAMELRESEFDNAISGGSDTITAGGCDCIANVTVGGKPSKESKKTIKKTKYKHWTEYPTWVELYKNTSSLKEYEHDRDTFMENLDIDWSEIIAVTYPKIDAPNEYIGRINRDQKTNKMYIVEMIASPTHVNHDQSNHGHVIATIPASIVSDIISKPALLVFHTHPRGGFEFPSPQDVVSSTYAMIIGHGAADLVISRFGIHMISILPGLREDTLASPNPHMYINRVLYDFVTGFDGIRSWDNWSIRDMNELYLRYRLQCITFPSSAYVHAAMHKWGIIRTTPTSSALLHRLQKRILDDKNIDRTETRAHDNIHHHLNPIRHTTEKLISDRIISQGGKPVNQMSNKFNHVLLKYSKDYDLDIDYALFSIVDESEYSSAMPWHVPAIKEFLKSVFPDVNNIMDLTAHIGTDLIIMATLYRRARLVGIEIDRKVFSILEQNIIAFDEAYPDREYKKRIAVINTPSERVISEIEDLSEIDIIYVDPPWNGKAYKDLDKVTLKLGEMTVEDIIVTAFSKNVRNVLIKVPVNFNFEVFNKRISSELPYIRIIQHNIMKPPMGGKPEKISYILIALIR